MEEEMIDIFDGSGKHIGVEKKSEIKKKGFWHQTFQCWVIIKEKDIEYIIFQRRHKNKKWNAGKLATSAGGHIMAGETVEDGIRELNEELGIYPNISELTYLGLYKEVRKTEKEDNKENQHVYLYVTNKSLENFNFQLEEISGLYKIPLERFSSLVEGAEESVVANGIEWDGISYKEKECRVELSEIVGEGTPFLKFSIDNIYKAINKK